MHFLLTHVIILCSLCKFITTDAMIGPNVKFANHGEFLFIVYLKRKNLSLKTEPENNHKCTGTLITKKDVITSAHCENKFKGYDCEVKVGSVNIREGKTFDVLWWISYDLWTIKKNKKHRYQEKDVAIARLKERVPEYVQIATFNNKPVSNYFEKMVSVATFDFTKKITSRMETVVMKIMTNKQCQDTIEKLGIMGFKITELLLCAIAKPNTLMSEGDSGSALFYKNNLIGVYKGTCPNVTQNNDPQTVNLFVSIFYFQEYIEDVIYNF